MMDKDLNGWDAVALSWQITSGHTGQIILIVMLAGCIMFMGMLLFGIGIIPAWIWVVLTIASFYNTLTAERD
jgi:hypoxanthine-guanine phosphoribosyltransferase